MPVEVSITTFVGEKPPDIFDHRVNICRIETDFFVRTSPAVIVATKTGAVNETSGHLQPCL